MNTLVFNFLVEKLPDWRSEARKSVSATRWAPWSYYFFKLRTSKALSGPWREVVASTKETRNLAKTENWPKAP